MGINKLKQIFKRQTLVIFFALAIFLSMFFYGISALLTAHNRQVPNTSSGSIDIPTQKGRILVILIDSLQKDAVFSNHMPFISQYREKGAWGTSEVLSTPLSMAGDKAIFAGIMASPFSLMDDFHPGTATYDNIFKRMSLQGKRVALFGPLISGAYGAYTDINAYRKQSFAFSEYAKAAHDIFRQAYPFLKKHPWDFAVVQFVSLDHIGHLQTPASKECLKALPLFDDYVRKLVSLTTDEDIVLITSEHGMDYRGFHTDRNPLVIETPFVLTGKPIKKGGPQRVLQIDWAPTLSLLAGVSPFYPSLALPALDLMSGATDQYSLIKKEFTRIYTGVPYVSTIEELHRQRLAKLVQQPASPAGLILIFATIVLAILLVYAALFEVPRQRTLGGAFAIPGGVLIIGAIAIFASMFSLPDAISLCLPFSANFMMAHPILALLFLSCSVAIYKLLKYFLGKKIINEDSFILFTFTAVFSFIFLAANPYHLLNWVALSIPLIGFVAAAKHRQAWPVIFFSVWTGLAIRRLTYFNAYAAVDLPDRWILASFILLLAVVFLWFRLRGVPGRNHIILLGAACFTPAVVIIAYPMAVEWKALSLACHTPVLFVLFKEKLQRETWMALWVVFFYLGTSSTLENTVHITAFPLLLAAWFLAQEASSIIKGIIISLILWTLYILPGNAFDLKLQDLGDSYLMYNVIAEKINLTVIVTATRYILPATILFWGATYYDVWSSRVSTLATALLPIVFGIGASFTTMMFIPSIGIPWEGFGRLTVLSCYLLLLLSAFLLASFLPRRADAHQQKLEVQ